MYAIVRWMVISGCLLGVAGAGEATWLERTVSRHDRTDVAEVVWGQESRDRRWVGRMDPPLFTRDPEQVEVVEVVRYTDVTWQRGERLARAWRESLPEGVYVVRMPTGKEGNVRHAFADHWPVHQRAYFAGRMLGIEREVHEAIEAMVGEHPLALGFDWQVRALAERVGVDPEVFARWVNGPQAVAWARMVSRVNRRRMQAEEVRGANVNRVAVYPSLLINGRYAVSASVAGSARKAYRVANRIIREELERGGASTRDQQTWRSAESVWRHARARCIAGWRSARRANSTWSTTPCAVRCGAWTRVELSDGRGAMSERATSPTRNW